MRAIPLKFSSPFKHLTEYFMVWKPVQYHLMILKRKDMNKIYSLEYWMAQVAFSFLQESKESEISLWMFSKL